MLGRASVMMGGGVSVVIATLCYCSGGWPWYFGGVWVELGLLENVGVEMLSVATWLVPFMLSFILFVFLEAVASKKFRSYVRVFLLSMCIFVFAVYWKSEILTGTFNRCLAVQKGMESRSVCGENPLRIWYVNLMDEAFGLNNAVSEGDEFLVIGTSIKVNK